MTDLNDLLAQIPMDKLASQLGVDEQTAELAARGALPALVGGMQANAQDPAGAASLAKAVTQHDPSSKGASTWTRWTPSTATRS